MKCSNCPYYECSETWNRCKITENECFRKSEKCDLVKYDGRINYDDEYFSWWW